MDKQIEKFEFRVIDNNTGEEADIEEIAFTEGWAEGLIYCDMEGFAILEDGNLVLLDECGNCAYCPNGRFSIIPENAVVLTEKEYKKLKNGEMTYNQMVRIITEKFAERLKEKLEERNIAGWIEDRRIEYWNEDIDEICKEITEGKKE